MFRRSPRVLALWGAAGAVALVTALVVASDLAALHRRAADLGPVVTAVVATRDLALGTALRASDLDERQIHQLQLPRGALEDARAIVGRVVSVPIVRGGFVADGNLAPRNRTGLDGAIPQGMRAMRVVAVNAVRPRAGAAVDVLATFDTSGSNRAAQTVVVAAGVLVIDTDAASDRADAGTRSDTLGVTLLVDSADAQQLAFAEANGVITITLVPPEDAARR
ncbi:MAG: Flp pilus assembly protein CpaB [Acidimicrobiia bacterium]